MPAAVFTFCCRLVDVRPVRHCCYADYAVMGGRKVRVGRVTSPHLLARFRGGAKSEVDGAAPALPLLLATRCHAPDELLP